MKRYIFVADARSVSGHQVYRVDAESEADALALVNRGEGEFVQEELEVQDLGPFELIDTEDVPPETPT